MLNILMSQEKSPMFDLVYRAYGGWKAWPRRPLNTNVSQSPRSSGCQFIELCHYKDRRTASYMWTTLLNWVQVHTCKHQNLPIHRTRRDFRSLKDRHEWITDKSYHPLFRATSGEGSICDYSQVWVLQLSGLYHCDWETYSVHPQS